MNKYLIEILKIVIREKGIVKFDDIVDEMSISKRRATYYLEQLDFYLCQNELAKIELNKTEPLSAETILQYKEFLKMIDINEYNFSANERKNIIVLHFLTSQEKLTLDSLSKEFKISRSTLINDMIEIKEFISKYSIKLVYQKSCGYEFVGDPVNIRHMGMLALNNSDASFASNYINDLLASYMKRSDVLSSIKESLTLITKAAEEHFSFFSIDSFVSSLILVSLIKDKYPVSIKLTRKDARIIELVEVIKLILKNNDAELIEDDYLYCMVAGSIITDFDPLVEDECIKVADMIIAGFNDVTGINLVDNKEIYKMFLRHMRSAYYRAKYRIKTNSIVNTNNEGGYFFIVSRLVERVNKLYDISFDSDEINLISYYFYCANIIKDNKNEKEEILIVCASGVGTSIYVQFQLSHLIKDMFRMVIVDNDEYKHYDLSRVKLIVTTVDLEKPKKDMIKVHTVFTDSDKKNIISWLMENMGQSLNTQVKELLTIFQDYGTILEKEMLFQKLNNYFYDARSANFALKDIFKIDDIAIIPSADNYADAIWKATRELRAEEIIDNQYVESILKTLAKFGPYCECAEGFYLIHGDIIPELLMPLIKVALFVRPVPIPSYNKEIRGIVVLVANDQMNHADALRKLVSNIVKNQSGLSSDISRTYKLLTE